jgi:hypothetical protein
MSSNPDWRDPKPVDKGSSASTAQNYDEEDDDTPCSVPKKRHFSELTEFHANPLAPMARASSPTSFNFAVPQPKSLSSGHSFSLGNPTISTIFFLFYITSFSIQAGIHPQTQTKSTLSFLTSSKCKIQLRPASD